MPKKITNNDLFEIISTLNANPISGVWAKAEALKIGNAEIIGRRIDIIPELVEVLKKHGITRLANSDGAEFALPRVEDITEYCGHVSETRSVWGFPRKPLNIVKPAGTESPKRRGRKKTIKEVSI